MIRLLPFILIPIILVLGFGAWKMFGLKVPTNAPVSEQAGTNQPVEVPKTLPEQSTDDKIKTLQTAIDTLVKEINSLKLANSSLDSKVKAVEGSNVDLKARVSALEKVAPTQTSSQTYSSSTIFIPLGSGGGPWANQDWYLTPEYEISLDPANYPGYKDMVLEVSFRLTESAGTGSVRLYNVTDGSATSGQIDTTSTSYSTKSTSSFKLASGTKTYKLQVKSTVGKDLFIQTARIRMSF